MPPPTITSRCICSSFAASSSQNTSSADLLRGTDARDRATLESWLRSNVGITDCAFCRAVSSTVIMVFRDGLTAPSSPSHAIRFCSAAMPDPVVTKKSSRPSLSPLASCSSSSESTLRRRCCNDEEPDLSSASVSNNELWSPDSCESACGPCAACINSCVWLSTR
eukprot:1073755-Rhodomonas_salina.1